MKVRFTDKISTREGREADVTDAAGKRLVDGGYAEAVDAPKPKAEPVEKPAAKKAPAKKAAPKATTKASGGSK